MSKTTVVPETKAAMIESLLSKGTSKKDIKAAVLEVYATCYSSEIDRVVTKLAKKSEAKAA
jgi:hypothetical protein